MSRSRRFLGVVVFFLLIGGCKKSLPPPKPVVVKPAEVTPVGTWLSSDRSARHLQMVFAPNGALSFQGGMSYFNPATWDYDPMRRVLTLFFPNASDEKLQVFKLYLGDGVQSLDRPGKRVTYRFDDSTSSLNVAGWNFTKMDTTQPEIAPEPTLR